MPTDVPTIAASASGLSMTRRLPKVRCRSSVTRNTPPSTPTSSPITSTSGSRSISCRSARFSAFTMLSFAMTFMEFREAGTSVGGLPYSSLTRCSGTSVGGLPYSSSTRCALAAHGGRRRTRLRPVATAVTQAGGDFVPLRAQVGRQLGVDVIEDDERVGRRCRLEAADRLGDLGLDLRLESLVEQVALLQIAAEAGERVLPLPLGDLLGRAIFGRVVRRGVHAEAIGHALDER